MKLSPRVAALGLSLAIFATGCPGPGHRIPHSDLVALSQLPPAQRGERVRIIQGLGGSEAPPTGTRIQGGASVVVVAPVWVGGHPRGRHHRSSPSHRPGGPDLAADKKESAKVWLVIAAIAATALVFTEGVRYDGWAKVHPMHPIHLWGAYGDYTWMPLADLTPEVANWAHRAAIRSDEGPWQPLGRAPLNRQGFSFSLLAGGAQIALEGTDPVGGFGSHILLGYYPLHQVGLQLDIGYGWAKDANEADVFDGRAGLELSVLPLSAGIIHAGAYGELGISSRSDDGIQDDDSSGFFGAGIMGQLELTTRLALTVRAGITQAYSETLSEITAGVSVY